MSSSKILIVLMSMVIASGATEFFCRFEESDYDKYACVIEDQNEVQGTVFALNTTGHEPPKSNNDVEQLMFDSSKLYQVSNLIFQIFTKLVSLQLKDNDLKVWKREYLTGASKLIWLQMWDNPIRSFDDDAFAEVPSLEILWIINSNVASINPKIFQHFTSLNAVNLSDNDFSENLQSNTFDYVAKTIVYINLKNTNITEIPIGMFRKFGSLQQLLLAGNDLKPIDASLTLPDNLEMIFVGKVLTRYQNPLIIIINFSDDTVEILNLSSNLSMHLS